MIVSTPNQSYRSQSGALVTFHYECQDEGTEPKSGLDHFAFRVVGCYRPARLGPDDQWAEVPFTYQMVVSFSNRHPVGTGAIQTIVTTKAVLDDKVREFVSQQDGLSEGPEGGFYAR